jgi:CBS-domain-containing membrane protein
MPAYCADWQMVDMTRLPGTPVAEHMTTDLVTAEPATPIRDLAWRMMEAHVHRIVILDEAGRPMGLVSSTDILAAVAHAPRGVAVEAGR